MKIGPKRYAHTEAERYADPGFQPDGLRRYALDTVKEIRAAWSYIHQRDNAARYSTDKADAIKRNIARAAARAGIKLYDQTASIYAKNHLQEAA